MTAQTDPRFVSRAVLFLSLIEFWERYSFYTTFALLALFTAAPVTTGGMGWDNGQSLRFFGVYLLVVQLTPIAGGYLADRKLSKRLALRFGALSLTAGHSLLATAAFLPWFSIDGTSLAQAAGAAGLPFGQWETAALPLPFVGIYHSASMAFYAGIALIAIGNGLFKPILTVIVGRLPHADEKARTQAFTSFFRYINAGGLVSVLLGGWLAQRFGWGWAFAGSAVGMLVAIATMASVEQRYIVPFADSVIRKAESPNGNRRANLAELWPIVVLLALLALAATFSFQSYGFVSLFTAQLVQRDIGGFIIPPSWFTALNPITIILLTPVLLRLWGRGGPGSDWTTTQHFGAALMLMALGFVPLAAAAIQAQQVGLANPLWIAATVILIAASELLYAPAGLAASTRLAPQHMQTLAIGAQGAAIGIGAWFSGQLGAFAFESGKVPVMSGVALLTALAAIGLWSARHRATRLGL